MVQDIETVGVAILETARIFEGDSEYFHICDYSVFGNRFEASLRITKHNPAQAHAFGDDAREFEIRVLGGIENASIVATMERMGRRGLRLPLRLMQRLAVSQFGGVEAGQPSHAKRGPYKAAPTEGSMKTDDRTMTKSARSRVTDEIIRCAIAKPCSDMMAEGCWTTTPTTVRRLTDIARQTVRVMGERRAI